MTTEAPEMTTCPLCKNVTLRKHCASPTCTWHNCTTKTCEAVLDPRVGRGLVLLSKDKQYKRGKDTVMHKRLSLANGEWINRDIA